MKNALLVYKRLLKDKETDALEVKYIAEDVKAIKSEMISLSIITDKEQLDKHMAQPPRPVERRGIVLCFKCRHEYMVCKEKGCKK